MDIGQFLGRATKAVHDASSKISTLASDANEKLTKAVTTEATFITGSTKMVGDEFAKTLNDLEQVCKTVDVQAMVFDGVQFCYVIKVTK